MTAFDFVIVGAGAAGCVLANRLSTAPRNSVLLIEAGPTDKTFLTQMPRGFAKLLVNEKRARFFPAGPDQGAKPNGEVWARGKMLGGSSSINGMLYYHGHPADYDGWEALGNRGWGWKDIGPIFRQIENHELGEGEYRGVGGPVDVSICSQRGPLMDRMIEAGRQMGIPVKMDLNDPDQEGIGYTVYNIGKGRRSGSAQAFLHPVMHRPNLHVVTNTLVTRILFEGNRAVGVACEVAGQTREYRARKEVILSAGALQTPQILQLSGIGPAALLRDKGIDVLHDSPGVGQNLREHCLMIMQRRLLLPYSTNLEYSGWRLVKNVLQYALTRKGLMAHPGFDMTGFVKTLADLPRPDVQLISSTTSMDLRSWDGWTKGPTLEKLPGMQLMGYNTNPRSQGSVRIKSADPHETPAIEINYLTDEYDRQVSIRMFRLMRRLLAQPALAGLIGEETVPGAQIESDEDILAAFATYSGPGYHACGSAKMGHDPMAVVDDRLRVHGVSGLRVADISIFPTQVAANTNAPAMATAWRAADIILEN